MLLSFFILVPVYNTQTHPMRHVNYEMLHQSHFHKLKLPNCRFKRENDWFYILIAYHPHPKLLNIRPLWQKREHKKSSLDVLTSITNETWNISGVPNWVISRPGSGKLTKCSELDLCKSNFDISDLFRDVREISKKSRNFFYLCIFCQTLKRSC